MHDNNQWWDCIPNAVRFISEATNKLKQRSVILLIPEDIPWFSNLLERISYHLCSPDRYVKQLLADEQEPGKFVLESFCKPELRNAYRSAIGYPKFLAQHDSESEMCGCYAVITNVTEDNVLDWAKFISEYEHFHKSGSMRCIFLLIYKSDKPLPANVPITTIRWSEYIQHYDCYMYALLQVSCMNQSKEIKEYLAEIISSVSKNDAELTSELVKYGTRCASDLQAVLKDISQNAIRSTGEEFEIPLADEQLRSIIWTAQIKIVFPIIERYRNSLIDSLSSSFDKEFRFTTVYGCEKTDYRELELGELIHLNSQKMLSLTPTQLTTASFYNKCRNTIAHFDTISFEDVIKAVK